MDRILVTGVTGQLGSAVVEALANRGFRVRAATRKTTKVKWTDIVQPVVFDYEDIGLHKAALDGVKGVFLIAPPLDFQAAEKLIPFIDKARAMGVEHIMFNSALGVAVEERSPLRTIEQYLMKSGSRYTILRPNFFMENFSTGFIAPMIAEGTIFLPAGDSKTSFISVNDIAEVAATAFEKKIFGVEYNLTGPEALGYGEAAGVLSAVAGIKVAYHAISEEEMLQGARNKGMPEHAAKYIALLFSVVRKGLTAAVTRDVHSVTGKDPISFAEFVQRNSGFWRMREAA
jgi:uncharacterized protein YbjT (DUF2867 family)